MEFWRSPICAGRGEEVGLAGSDPVRFQTLMARLKEQVQFAESIGFDAFAMTEQHMQVEGIETTTNPLMWDYFVAQHTTTMRVGQIGMNIPCVNPIKLAEDIAMLDHFTGGRVFAGFTRGNTPRWTATFGQQLRLMSTESDKSENDKRNRAAFAEGWEIIKALWTNDTVHYDGEFWKVPQPVEWDFNPTKAWGRGVNADGKLTEIGIVPRPLQQPHPPVYAPFSFSVETVKFWAREGGKMLCMVSPEKEEYIQIMMDAYMEEAAKAGRNPSTGDAVAIGGHLTLGRNAAERAPISMPASRSCSTSPTTRRPTTCPWAGCSAARARKPSITSRASPSATASRSFSCGTISAIFRKLRRWPC